MGVDHVWERLGPHLELVCQEIGYQYPVMTSGITRSNSPRSKVIIGPQQKNQGATLMRDLSFDDTVAGNASVPKVGQITPVSEKVFINLKIIAN